MTLHRLRKALGGAEWVTLTNDRYRVNPALLEEFDALEFEREIVDARRALKRQAPDAMARLEQALTRFRGDFLDGEPAGDWHLEHRDRFKRLFVESLRELGACLTTEERHARAADAYRCVLARDDLHEDAVIALMHAPIALGERSQAVRVYRQFADRMRRELDAEPSAATRRLVERLQQGTTTPAAAVRGRESALHRR